MTAATVFVTGATGFVGSWLTQALLDQGCRVVCLIRDLDPRSEFARAGLLERVSTVYGELQSYSLLESILNQHTPQKIFHLGAQTQVKSALRAPFETFESNIRGTYNLLEAARRVNCAEAIVVASSDKSYGEMKNGKYVETS